MDGVLYLGNTPIPGAARCLRALERMGKHVGLLTNNSGQSTASVIRRLERLGFSAENIDVLVATSVTAEWLAEQRPGGTAYVVGSHELCGEIERAGLRVFAPSDTPPLPCDFLVVGNYRGIDYACLGRAIRVGRAGATFVAVNRDHLFPVEDGLRPGAGAIVQAIAAGIGRGPDVLIGKPSPLMVNRALQRAGLSPERCLMVGDTVDIDVRMGQAAGMATALVLTGVDSKETIATYDIRPTYVLDSIADIVDHLPV